MDENKRNQQNQSDEQQQSGPSMDQQGNPQNVSSEGAASPRGSNWKNNYQPRESDQERGSDEEDNSNGGTLY